MKSAPPFGFVVIGRNEGTRFLRCLESLKQLGLPIVYVDSGSTDGSLGAAAAAGAEVLNLDVSKGFNMSRARNAGWKKLLDLHPGLEFVQFLDGDCELESGWTDHALRFLSANPKTAVVCGRRRERHPENSVYNRLTDIEWNTPIGPSGACGGDSMMRVAALKNAGGFDETLIAGEEPELCYRMRQEGWNIQRIDSPMTIHDADLQRFSQWWKRHVRAGYGASFIANRQRAAAGKKPVEILFEAQVKSPRTWVFGSLLLFLILVVPSVCRLGILHGTALAFLLILLAWVAQAIRIALHQKSRAGSFTTALVYGISLMIAKWAELSGQIKSFRDRRSSKQAQIIEYK